MSAPLTPYMLNTDQIGQLRGLDDTIKHVRAELARAKSAGIDVSQFETQLNTLDVTRKKMLQVYGRTQVGR